MSRAVKLLFVTWATLALVFTGFGATHAQSPAEGTVRNFSYRVWYATQWQVVRFPTVQQAVEYRDKIMGSAGAGGYEAKLADFSSAPDGSIRPGSGPNTEVYVRQWLNDGFESDPHNAFTKLIALKRHVNKPETRVQLDYDVRSDDTPFGWVTRSVLLPELAGEWQQTETAETTVKGNLVLNASGELRGEWADGSGGLLRLEYWDQNQVVFTRRDDGGTNGGLTARYVGRFVGSSLMGEVAWNWQGRTWSGTWNASLANAHIAQPQLPQGCTRGEGVVLEKGSAIAVEGNILTYTSPDTGVTNTIRWDPPPPSITIGDEVTLMSWATHNDQPNGIEVQWETKGSWGYGASSTVTEESKALKLRYAGGPISVVGGVRHGGAAGKFRMQWNYNCR